MIFPHICILNFDMRAMWALDGHQTPGLGQDIILKSLFFFFFAMAALFFITF